MENTYIVKKGDTLYGIAKKFNTSVQSIKELNNLKSNIINVGDTLIVKKDDDINPMECIVYTVKKGDNLYNIAKKYNTDVDSIKRYNNLKSNLLNIGDKLVIPCNVVNDYKNNNENYISYIVEKNDTIYSIANKFGTTVDKIKKDNDLTSNNISVGQILIVDDRNNISSVKECYGNGDYSVDSLTYTVQKGDTLYSIANKYGVSVDSIKQVNNLSSNDLKVGEQLYIPNNMINIYVVKKGDSLFSIAKKFNTSVDSIKRKNNLTSNLISIGQELKI